MIDAVSSQLLTRPLHKLIEGAALESGEHIGLFVKEPTFPNSAHYGTAKSPAYTHILVIPKISSGVVLSQAAFAGDVRFVEVEIDISVNQIEI